MRRGCRGRGYGCRHEGRLAPAHCEGASCGFPVWRGFGESGVCGSQSLMFLGSRCVLPGARAAHRLVWARTPFGVSRLSVADLIVEGGDRLAACGRLDSLALSLIDGAAAARVVRPPAALVSRTGGVRTLPRLARTLSQGAGILRAHGDAPARGACCVGGRARWSLALGAASLRPVCAPAASPWRLSVIECLGRRLYRRCTTMAAGARRKAAGERAPRPTPR